MKNISEQTMNRLKTELGLRPINVLEIEWVPGGIIKYADKSHGDIQGRILKLSDLDSVMRTDVPSSVSSVSITLDDTDGALKFFYDNIDIHKRPVRIYQWFEGTPYGDKFILFEGQISSPIVWAEADRTLSFEIISMLNEVEVGFAPEDGQFKDLDVDLVGKPWPLCFGRPRMLTPIRLTPAPQALTLEPFAIPDFGLWEQLFRLKLQLQSLDEGAPLLQNINDSDMDLDSRNAIHAQNAKIKAQWDAQVAERKAQIKEQEEQIYVEIEKQMEYSIIPIQLDGKVPSEIKSVPIWSKNFPTGECIVQIGSLVFSATVGNTNIRLRPPLPSFEEKYLTNPIESRFDINFTNLRGELRDLQHRSTSTGFQWFPAGSEITLLSDYPVQYLVCCTPTAAVELFAYRSYGGLKELARVPNNYFEFTQKLIPIRTPAWASTSEGRKFLKDLRQWLQVGGVTTPPKLPRPDIEYSWLTLTYVTLRRPLSKMNYIINDEYQPFHEVQLMLARNPNKFHRIQNFEEWEDDFYVNVNSAIWGNAADVIKWAIENFTMMAVDPESFEEVSLALSRYPVNFALTQQKNLIEFVSEVAMQSRCSVWLKEGVFYIKYLPADPEPVDVITKDDIVHGSLQLTGTDTENLVTKYVATYQRSYKDDQSSKVIVKHNIIKYGTIVEEHDYYIFNNHYAVKKSATFWIIRKSNTWKQIKFSCFINKLHLEVHDTVLIDLPDFEINVKGVIESAVYNSENNSIDFLIWLPIRMGETEPYVFAWPQNISTSFVFPQPDDLKSGGGTKYLDYGSVTLRSRTSNSAAVEEVQGKFMGHTGDELRLLDTSQRPDSLGVISPSDGELLMIQSNYSYDEPPNITRVPSPEILPYPGDLQEMEPITAPGQGEVFIGYILSSEGEKQYLVKLIGVENNEETEENEDEIIVTQLQIADGEVLPSGSAVIVVRIDGTYYMQVPVWL